MNLRRTSASLIVLGALALTACAAPYSKDLVLEKPPGSPAALSGGRDSVEAAADAISSKLDDVEAAARRGDYASAQAFQAQADSLYEERLAPVLDSRDPTLAGEIDGQFGSGDGTLLALIGARASPDRIAAGVARLRDSLEAAKRTSAASVTGTWAAFNSAAIIVREGLEAILILAVILGTMRTTKRDPRYGRLIVLGAGAGIVLSLLTWWASLGLFSITSVSRQVMEGATSLLAVAVLFYVTNWLFHKAYVVDWMTFIQEETGKALATGSVLGLMALGFTVVYREGFETVLFYQTILFNTDPAPVITGLVAGLALLALIAFGVLNMSVRLPVRPFFAVTGLLMLVLAFKFAGLGVHEFQEARLIGATPFLGMSENPVLRDVLGLYPLVEPLAVQAALIVALAATFTLSRWQWKRPRLQP